MKAGTMLPRSAMVFVMVCTIVIPKVFGQVSVGGKPVDADFSELAKKMGWCVEREGKKYFRLGQRVGRQGEKLVPVSIIGGLPFPISSLAVEGELQSPLTIKIIGAKIIGDKESELIPSEDSPVPVYEQFDPFMGKFEIKFYTQALNVTWQFMKPGIKFTADGILYVVEKEKATISFRKDGIHLEGITKRKLEGKSKSGK
ncbi:MAG: hypothetical protein NZ602_01390 [Thermoguttaceae bacterium]|nr:hypothetical protein [Thermoguttaceae bacterium]MDW8037204.1 hypothetical protein [Thermoguttaceae bacterium]